MCCKICKRAHDPHFLLCSTYLDLGFALTDKKKTILRVLPLIVLLVGIVLFSGFYAIAAKYLQRPVFPDGAYIDDIAVGGMHAEQAREKVEASFK